MRLGLMSISYPWVGNNIGIVLVTSLPEWVAYGHALKCNLISDEMTYQIYLYRSHVLMHTCFSHIAWMRVILLSSWINLVICMDYTFQSLFCFNPDIGSQSHFLSRWMYPCQTSNRQACLACSLRSCLVLIAPCLYHHLRMITCSGRMSHLRLHSLLLVLLHSHYMHAVGMLHIFRRYWGPCRSECEVVYVIWMLLWVHHMIPLLFDTDLCNSRNYDFHVQLAVVPSNVPWGFDPQLFLEASPILRPLMGAWEFLD